MSVSRPFIERPIATSLLAVAAVLGGILGYLTLPISSLPQVDFPTVEVRTELPGASPDTMAKLVTASLERQFGQIQSLASMSSISSFGLQPHHAAVQPRARYRCRRPGRAGRHQCRRLHLAAQPPLSADLRQGQSGRHAHHHAGADLGNRVAAPAVRSRRHADRPAHECRIGRRPRVDRGRHQARGEN